MEYKTIGFGGSASSGSGLKDEKMGCTYNNTKIKEDHVEYLSSAHFNCEGDYCNGGAVDKKNWEN